MQEVDPLGKRALFAAPADPPDPVVGAAPDGTAGSPGGKEALYSTGAHRPGTVVFECSRCETRTRMSLIEAGVRVLWFTVWIPGKQHNRFIQCPRCQRHTWSRIDWFG